jgi:hypothetical protein
MSSRKLDSKTCGSSIVYQENSLSWAFWPTEPTYRVKLENEGGRIAARLFCATGLFSREIASFFSDPDSRYPAGDIPSPVRESLFEKALIHAASHQRQLIDGFAEAAKRADRSIRHRAFF